MHDDWDGGGEVTPIQLYDRGPPTPGPESRRQIDRLLAAAGRCRADRRDRAGIGA